MLRTFCFLILLSVCPFSWAKTLNLYDEPNTTAKIVGKIDSEKGFVPIFTPKEGGWVKVGDPSNGTVGWIKSSDLNQADHNVSGFTFSQKIVDNGNGPQSYIVQFGTPKPISAKDAEAMIKQMQKRQLQIQQEAQKMMQDIFGKDYQSDPLFMPIFILPSQDQFQKPKPKN